MRSRAFVEATQDGRFPQLQEHEDPWPLLLALTTHKAIDLVRYERRVKRGGSGQQHAAIVGPAEAPAVNGGLSQLIGKEPDPQAAFQVAEECQDILDRLSDTILRAIALWKMEGFTTEEIAAKLGCTTRTIERKLQFIRRLWDCGDTLAMIADSERPPGVEGLTDSQLWRIDQICDGFEVAWQSGAARGSKRFSTSDWARHAGFSPRACAPRCRLPEATGRVSGDHRLPASISRAGRNVAGCRALASPGRRAEHARYRDDRIAGACHEHPDSRLTGRACEDDQARMFGKFQLLERVGVGRIRDCLAALDVPS